MLISIQVKSGAQVVRPFGLTTVPANSTLMHVYEGLVNGHFDTGDKFRMPELAEYDVRASVSLVKDKDFMTVPLTSNISEITDFGKFLLFEMDPDYTTNSKKNVESQKQDAFHVMMDATRARRRMMFPPFKAIAPPRQNKKFQLHNDVIDFIKKHEIGWSADTVEYYG